MYLYSGRMELIDLPSDIFSTKEPVHISFCLNVLGRGLGLDKSESFRAFYLYYSSVVFQVLKYYDKMGDGMLSLSWNNHKATFCHILSTLREKVCNNLILYLNCCIEGETKDM